MNIFRRHPKENLALPTEPVEYPAGLAFRTPSGMYYLNRDGKRYKIQSEHIMRSWKFPLIIETSDIALSNYPVAVTKLGFRDGTLLYNVADAKIYLASAGKLLHVVSPEVFDRLGIKFSDAMWVPDADIKIMVIGGTIG